MRPAPAVSLRGFVLVGAGCFMRIWIKWRELHIFAEVSEGENMNSWKRTFCQLWSVKWVFVFIIPAIVLFVAPGLLAPFAWLLICIIAAIVLSVKLRSRIVAKFQLTSGPYLLLTICVIVGIILLFANDQRRPSRVDISPLAELGAEEIERVEDAIVRLEEHNAIRNFRIHNFELRRGYIFNWDLQYPEELRIIVTIHPNAQRAMESIQGLRWNRANRSQSYTYIVNGNNTEAVLDHSFMPRWYGLAIPVSVRHVRSTIRIGNVTIGFTEYLSWYNLRNDHSSRFIALLVEMLQEEDSP